MKLLNYLFFNMFGSVLECCELTIYFFISQIYCAVLWRNFSVDVIEIGHWNLFCISKHLLSD